MTQISKKVNNEILRPVNTPPQFKSAPETQNNIPDIQIPDIYYNSNPGKEQKGFVEKLKEVDMMGMIYPWFENPLLMGGTCLALSKGIDKYTEACGGEYEKSILGKATKLGDNIENSKFIKSSPVQKVLGWIKSGAKRVENLCKKSDLITAMRTTPARPEKQMPKSELISQEVRIIEDFNKITDTLNLTSENSVKLKNLGLNKAERDFLEQTFGKNYKKISEEKLANAIQLKRLDYAADDITRIVNSSNATNEVKKAILQKLGLTIDEITEIKANPEKYVNKVKEAVTKAGDKVKIGAGHYPILGPVQPLERTISCGQVANRLKSIMDGAKTNTGKFFAKAIQKIHRGFTFGGGKLGMCLFIAPSFVMMMKNTVKADKDSKIGTVANGCLEAISWVFTFPLAIAATYALGGMKFAGMSKDKVKEFMKITDDFNKLVDEGKLVDKSKYDAARKVLETQRKNLRNVEKQNLLARTFKGIANIFYGDLNTIRSYKNNNALMNKIRQIPNFLKHITCEPVRFILAVFVIESFFRNVIIKGTKAVFGNYYDHFKEEEYTAKKSEQKKFTKEDLQKRLYDTQAKKLNPTEQTNDTKDYEPDLPKEALKLALSKNDTNKISKKNAINANSEKSENLLKETNNKAVIETIENNDKKETENKYIPDQTQKLHLNQTKTENMDNYTYIPSSENIFASKDKEKTNANKYIPSQTAGNFVKTFDNSGLEAALKRADRAEKLALQTLAGNFNHA